MAYRTNTPDNESKRINKANLIVGIVVGVVVLVVGLLTLGANIVGDVLTWMGLKGDRTADYTVFVSDKDGHFLTGIHVELMTKGAPHCTTTNEGRCDLKAPADLRSVMAQVKNDVKVIAKQAVSLSNGEIDFVVPFHYQVPAGDSTQDKSPDVLRVEGSSGQGKKEKPSISSLPTPSPGEKNRRPAAPVPPRTSVGSEPPAAIVKIPEEPPAAGRSGPPSVSVPSSPQGPIGTPATPSDTIPRPTPCHISGTLDISANLFEHFARTFMPESCSPPYSWSHDGLPPGLELNSASGLLEGNPSRAGIYDFRVNLRDGTSAPVQSLVRMAVLLRVYVEIPDTLSVEKALFQSLATECVAKPPFKWVERGADPYDAKLICPACSGNGSIPLELDGQAGSKRRLWTGHTDDQALRGDQSAEVKRLCANLKQNIGTVSERLKP